MPEEDDLRARISELDKELENKEYEIHGYIDKIEQLEEKISKLEFLFPEESDKKKEKKQEAINSKLSFIEEKDREIRELRDRMGFLRKEKIQLQQELEKIKKSLNESSVIRVEDLREKTPLNLLVKELQDKVNKQRIIINRLEQQNEEVGNFNKIQKEKDDEINTYKSEILELNQKLKDLSSSSEDKDRDSITKKLIEDLQSKLHKTKMQIIDLKQKIGQNEKKHKRKEKTDNISKQLVQPEVLSTGMMIELKGDLQNKLNEAKMQIQNLKQELKNIKIEKVPAERNYLQEIEEELKTQTELAISLQKQIDIKEGEFETIKNEAVQIKKRYRQLESQLKLKDQKIDELLNKLESQPVQNQPKIQPQTISNENPHLNLRLNEMKNMIDDLKKQNYEQRIEISQLRKKV